ncbi:hypothetical protein [Legionella tunisiensis]|uniref:hypothetical protein n=1 Tax=Legionella tunisiensis TaxID=1034944 RepID=UPI0002FDCBCB|nr:hypothetical protein [Legionella tunisiensis]
MAFTDLLQSLGGKEALEYLEKEGQLNGKNLAYLEKHPADTVSLARFIVLVHQGISPAEPTLDEVIDKINIAELPEKLIDITRVLSEKLLNPTILTRLIQCDSSSCLTDVLILLARHGLNKEENISHLPHKENLLMLKNILETLEKTDLKLMLQTNVAAILRFGSNLGELNSVLTELKLAKQLTQAHLTKIFEYVEVVTMGSWLATVLRIFRQADWDIEHNLEAILAAGSSGQEAADFIKIVRLPDY